MKRFLILLITPLLIISCNKTQNEFIDFKPLIKVSNDYTKVEQMTVRLLSTFFKAAGDSLVLTEGYNPNIDGAVCRYTIDTITDSVFYRIFYGSWGVIDPYSKRRGGKIFINLNGSLEDSLTKGIFIFQNFHYEFDTIKTDSLEIQNIGKNAQGNTQFHIKALKMQWEVDSTHVISWNFDQIFERIKMKNSIFYNNNEKFLIYGKLTGKSSTNIAFTATNDVGNEIVLNCNCAWLQNGKIKFEVQNFNNAQILFPAENNCSNRYELWIDDNRFDKSIE